MATTELDCWNPNCDNNAEVTMGVLRGLLSRVNEELLHGRHLAHVQLDLVKVKSTRWDIRFTRSVSREGQPQAKVTEGVVLDHECRREVHDWLQGALFVLRAGRDDNAVIRGAVLKLHRQG